MRNLIYPLIIALLAGIATWFLPWWMIAVIPFVLAIAWQLRPVNAFLLSAAGICLLWLVVILVRDIPNDHILSSRMAKLFSLPGAFLFIVVNLVVGGLVAGLAGWAGALMNRAFRRIAP
ncbi:hypothetical protein [Polluticoccus soli]|uniref:hypothetical protein n=1 Tax=Polluticoccus soli TaxID=3034150 RepID=UPI0023E231A4|nr:hypothetical protein [Flavipsychrobacter sp. JY13-12]